MKRMDIPEKTQVRTKWNAALVLLYYIPDILYYTENLIIEGTKGRNTTKLSPELEL